MSYQGTLFLTNDFIQSVINSDSLDNQCQTNKVEDYERDKLASISAVSKPVSYDDILVEMTDLFGTKSPISMLMEYMQYSKSRVNFIEIGLPEGPDHKPIFTMVAVVDGQPYTRVQAKTKKDARTGAAYLAWKIIIFTEQEKLENCMSLDISSEDFMTCKVYLEYLTQVLRNPLVFCGRKVLSAIVMIDQSKTENGFKFKHCKVVSLGTGNRCISSHHLSLDGLSVNDSHAEVITRRAFLRFLHDELIRHSLGEDTIFVKRSNDNDDGDDEINHDDNDHHHHHLLLEVKSSIEFHLYISALPCGDASVFSKEKFKSNDPNRSINNYDEDKESPIFDSAVQGLLRTKIEAGEGAIPAERSHLQSWVGLLFGNRLRTMCCSDKILKWNVVGLQGALLSRLMKPIYLSSVIVGESFIRGHVTRALYYRLAKNELISICLSEQSFPSHSSIENPVPDLDLPQSYKTAYPSIVRSNFVDLFQQQETEKSSALAVVWYSGLDKAEVFDGTTGKFPNESDSSEHPCVCKKLLFESLKKAWKCLRGDDQGLNSISNNDNNNKDDNNNDDNDLSYFSCKHQAHYYQDAKKIFYKHMGIQGLGGWITKPVEIDFFD